MVSTSFQRVSAVNLSRPRSGSDFVEMYVGVAWPHPMGKGSERRTEPWESRAGWWFGTWLLYAFMIFHSVGNGIIIPTDKYFFRGGRYTTNQRGFVVFLQKTEG